MAGFDLGAILDLVQGGGGGGSSGGRNPIQRPQQSSLPPMAAPQGLGEYIGRANTSLPVLLEQFQNSPQETYQQISSVVGPDKADEFLQYFNMVRQGQ